MINHPTVDTLISFSFLRMTWDLINIPIKMCPLAIAGAILIFVLIDDINSEENIEYSCHIFMYHM